MARATTRTLLSLDRFAQLVGINPLHFNQTKIDSLAPLSTCDVPIFQYDWQDAGKSGRESLADTIATVESLFDEFLGFSPGVRWSMQESQMVGDNRASFNLFRFKLNHGHVISGGQEAWSSIQTGVAVAYTDVDGDGYKEKATITVNVGAVTDVDEVAIVYPGHSDSPGAWEIRPTGLSITNSVATLTCRREQLVVESMLEGFGTLVADGETDADFLTTVDVYRHYNDPSQQVNLLWPPLPSPWPSIDSNTDASAVQIQTGYIVPNDARNGIVSVWPGTWNGAGFDYICPPLAPVMPQRAQLWYRSGLVNPSSPRPKTTMESKWERAIAYMVLSMLDRPLCACPTLEGFTRYWSEDLSAVRVSGDQSSSWHMSPSTLNNPLGTTRGAINAWRLIQKEMLGQAAIYA